MIGLSSGRPWSRRMRSSRNRLSEPLYSSAPNVLRASACAIQSLLDTASRLFLGSQRTVRATCHELAFFTFFSLLFYCIDTCCYSPKSHFKHKLTLLIIHSAFLLCFRPLRKSKARVFSPKNVANTTLRTTTDGPFGKQGHNKSYLIVRKDDRTRDPL